MKKIAATLLIQLVMFAPPGFGAEPSTILSAAVLAEAVRQASYSDGFEERMNITTVNSEGHRSVPVKLAVIGQFGTERQRLLIRGISPANVRDRFVFAERHADGWIRANEYGAHIARGNAEVDMFSHLFDTELVIWDMFSPWWHWPKQSLGGTEKIDGRNCIIVRSQSDSKNYPIREVVSCVDKDAGLSLKTQLFDGRHKLIRTISVVKMVGKESGAMAAKEVTIKGPDNSVTEAELYSGDEHHSITPDTFPTFNSHPIAGKSGG
jgi:Outer membrane lipoprotein-sorting protein